MVSARFESAPSSSAGATTVIAQVLNAKPGTTTLPPIIAAMMGQANIDYSVIAASGFLSALPAVLLAVVFQRYMVQGLTAGSVKG
jgi:multiple sugar transport system permease protein